MRANHKTCFYFTDHKLDNFHLSSGEGVGYPVDEIVPIPTQVLTRQVHNFAKEEVNETTIFNSMVEDINIFPNPTVDYININGDFTTVSIIDMAGKVIVKSTDRRIDVSSLVKGIYLIKIDTPTGSLTRKLMKQ